MGLRLAIGLTAAILISGCGSDAKSIAVKGRIVQSGAPFKPTLGKDEVLPPGDPGIRVKFVRLDSKEEAGEESYLAVVDPEAGTFQVLGPTGKGIPPGKYRAIVFAGATGASDKQESGSLGVPPTVENGVEEIAMDGKEVARQEVTITEAGADIELEVKPAAKAKRR